MELKVIVKDKKNLLTKSKNGFKLIIIRRKE